MAAAPLFRYAAIVVTTACGRIAFDPAAADSAVADDAAVPPYGGFQNPISLEGGGTDSQLRADRLEVFHATSSPDYEISFEVRASPTDAFGAVAPVPNINDPGTADNDPALSLDGLVLVFISERSGASRAYEARRPDLASDFGAPVLVAGLEDVEVHSLELGPSGNVLYFVFDHTLYRTERPDRASPFAPPVVIDAPPLTFPTVSPDELLLFANAPAPALNVLWATRATTSEPFVARGLLDVGTPDCSLDNTQDADITPDGTALVVRCPAVKLLTR